MSQNPQGIKISVAEPSDNVSPLVRFRGVLKEYKIEQRHNDQTGRDSVGVSFGFVDVTVIESREPYPFPIATVRISYSDRANTRWAAFTKSYRALLPQDVLQAAAEPLDPLVGKMQEWWFGPAKLRTPDENQVWAVRDGEAWQLVSIEGYGQGANGNRDIMGAIVDFADGKKDAEIYQWLYTNQELKGYQGYNAAVEAVADRKLLSTLIAGGKLKSNTDGTYSKVGS